MASANPQRLLDTFKIKLTEDEFADLILCMNEADNWLYELVCEHFKQEFPDLAKEMFVQA